MNILTVLVIHDNIIIADAKTLHGGPGNILFLVFCLFVSPSEFLHPSGIHCPLVQGGSCTRSLEEKVVADLAGLGYQTCRIVHSQHHKQSSFGCEVEPEQGTLRQPWVRGYELMYGGKQGREGETRLRRGSVCDK